MRNIFREQRRSSIAMAVITLLLGLLLVLAPNRSIRFLCTLLGAALLITGLLYLFSWLSRQREGFPVWFLIPGLILAALGLLLSAVILWCCVKVVPWIIRGIVGLIRYPFRKAGAKK